MISKLTSCYFKFKKKTIGQYTWQLFCAVHIVFLCNRVYRKQKGKKSLLQLCNHVLISDWSLLPASYLISVWLYHINVKVTRNQHADNVVSINKIWRWSKAQKDNKQTLGSSHLVQVSGEAQVIFFLKKINLQCLVFIKGEKNIMIAPADVFNLIKKSDYELNLCERKVVTEKQITVNPHLFLTFFMNHTNIVGIVIGRSLVQFPWSACWSVLGHDTEPQTAPDVLVGTLHGSHHYHCLYV